MPSNRRAVALVVGARPQFIKAAAIVKQPLAGASWVLVHTGQHYDYELSAVFFKELGIPAPDYHLGVGAASPAVQLEAMVSRLRDLLRGADLTAAAVVGDTTSTLAGALAATLTGTPCIHVEAGMRSGVWEMVEERNRVITDRLSQLHLCPHPEAAANLAAEGLTATAVVVGDVMYEAAASCYGLLDAAALVTAKGLAGGGYAYVSCHRAENVDTPSRLGALAALLRALPCRAYFPVHPRTARNIQEFGLRPAFEATGAILAPPASYLENLALIRHAGVVVTDSGGVTREAYLFDVPTLTLREVTEWPETVEAGVNRLVGLDPEAARAGAKAALRRQKRQPRWELVGEPSPSARIAAAVTAFISGL